MTDNYEGTIEPQPEEITIVEGPMSSSDLIADLVGALAAAQLEFAPVLKNCQNKYFGTWYADLSSVISATQTALARAGLVIMQFPVVQPDYAGVKTLLAHKSGQWMSNQLMLPVPKIDAQGVGIALTYARRYAYQAMVGVAGEVDDDANSISGAGPGAREPIKPPQAKNQGSTPTQAPKTAPSAPQTPPQRSYAPPQPEEPPPPQHEYNGVSSEPPRERQPGEDPFELRMVDGQEVAICTSAQQDMLYHKGHGWGWTNDKIHEVLKQHGVKSGLVKDLPVAKLVSVMDTLRGGPKRANGGKK